ncbi:uncharacterized protein LOC119959801 isoform X2 [Scyliorhinus canicula]|uniref:uncharacterized protein LOC119959801 isoform X2 n=1 Tax=Scyliorhinus canicula TaxID=7830 RepID=UPI0018F40BCF|nr:uncharacterized protein LOC119959801 isoform X2 [Scyliorhinus canicula]
MWNLSALSRGSGQLVNREHERLDVYLEAQDYFNWRSTRNSDCVSLKLHNPKGFLHHHLKPAPPKTFSTRRGALVLYSEDLALQSWQRQHAAKWRHRARLRFTTLQDLAMAVLAYGQRTDGSGLKRAEPYLHFPIGHRNQPGNRKIRPGYSAKRYLACLAETCGPYRQRASGCPNNLEHLPCSSLNSLLQQQANCDLSKVPRPYHTLPCLPTAHLSWSSPSSQEEEEVEPFMDSGDSCPVSDDGGGGMQCDSKRPGTRERQMDMESGGECEDPQESALYVLITLPADELEQIAEEAQQAQGTQQALNRLQSRSLSRCQPAPGKAQGQRPNILRQPTIDSSQLCSQKSRMTYYGGSLAGVRRGPSVKNSPNNQCGSRQQTEPAVSLNGQLQLPPLSSEIGAGLRPMVGEGSGELGRWKLPSIKKPSIAAARHAGRLRVGSKPGTTQLKPRLDILLKDINHQKQKEEDIHDEAAENKGKSEAPDSMETSRTEGLDQAAQLNGGYSISAEQRLAQVEENVGILPAISSQTEMERRTVRYITIRIKEDENLLEEIKEKSEIPEPTETSRMKELDQAARIKKDYPISTQRRASRAGANVGILPEISSQTGMAGRMVGFIGIRIEEDGNLFKEIKGKSEIPVLTETSRMKGLDQASRINKDYPISAERSASLGGRNVGTLPEISSQTEMEGKTVGFIGIRIEEDGNLLEGSADQSLKPRSVLQVLPPIHNTGGPVKQKIKAGVRRKAHRNKTSSPGAVRGIVPKELKEVHKDTSVGSLLLAPDGEIVHLSWLGSVQCPNGNWLANAPHQQEHFPLEYGVNRKKTGLVSNQELEEHFPLEYGVNRRKTGLVSNQELEEHLPLDGDVSGEKDAPATDQELEDADIVSGSEEESGQFAESPHRSSRRRLKRKAFRRGGRRQTDPDGDTLEPESGTARGAKVSSNRRANVNGRGREDVSDPEEMELDEDGNPCYYSPQSYQNSVYDSEHEGEAVQGMKRTTHGSTYRKSTKISSLSGWSQAQPSSLSATEDMGEFCGLHAAVGGDPSNPRRRKRGHLRKDGHVVAMDSGSDAEDQEAELWNEVDEGSAGIKTKKQTGKRKKGQKNLNQDPNAQDNNSESSSSEEARGSLRSNRATGLNKPLGQRSSLRSNQMSGLDKPSESRNSLRQLQESGFNKTTGSRGSMNKKQAPGPNNERNKNSGRAEFVVGRPREKRLPQQRHLSQLKQNEASKPRKKRTVRGGGSGGEDDWDTQYSSEDGGPQHSTRKRNTLTSGSTDTATAADGNPNSRFTDIAAGGAARDQARWSEGYGESHEVPQGATRGPGSSYPTRSGSSKLANEQRPQAVQQDRGEQRQREMELRIQQELDDDRKQKEQATSNKRKQTESEAMQQQEVEQSRQHQEQRERERKHRQQEEYRRKVQEVQQRKEKVLAERAEETERLQRERRKQQQEEEELLKGMDEPQRQEYFRMKQIKEEQEKEELAEQRKKEEERSEILMKAVMQEAMFLLREKGLMQRDLMLSRNLWVEFIGLERAQNITRPWVFSYVELIKFLGLERSIEEEIEESSPSGQLD